MCVVFMHVNAVLQVNMYMYMYLSSGQEEPSRSKIRQN